MKIFNDLPDLFYLGFYHPQYIYYENCREDNEYFNEYSNTILELKNQEYHAVNFFLQEFKRFLSNEDIAISTVPPHTSDNPSSGIRELAKQLVKSYSNFTDAVFCLERFQNSSCNRTIDNHLNSIKVANSSLIKEKKVILIDDVLTTGSSIQACKKLLLEAGAKEVKVIVLGKTIRNVEDAHYFIDQKINEYLQETLEELHVECCRSSQAYKIQKDCLKEKSINEHISVDEWANEQHSYFDPDDDEHYDIEEDAQQQHEAIDERYNELFLDIYREEQKEDSFFEHEKYMAEDSCQYIVDEAHQVLAGSSCFSVHNPFVFYFKDW